MLKRLHLVLSHTPISKHNTFNFETTTLICGYIVLIIWPHTFHEVVKRKGITEPQHCGSVKQKLKGTSQYFNSSADVMDHT